MPSTGIQTSIFSFILAGLLAASAEAQPVVLSADSSGNPDGVTFSFDDGLVPAGTRLAVGPDAAGNQINPGLGVTNAGGFNNSGALILCAPSTGQSFGQWRLTNDFANGVPVTHLHVSFKLFMGNGTGGNSGVPNAGGNGMVFHWGPGLLEQYTGGASSWGQGLDVTFRTYNSAPNTVGINIYYGGTAGAGQNPPLSTSAYLDYFQTDGPADDFSEAVDVSLSVSNGILNLTVTPTNGVSTDVFSNYAIPGFAPMPLGGNNLAFTSTDGSGSHESCWLDNVDLTVNGIHVNAGSQPTGPVAFTVQPASVTTNENVEVKFTAAVSGAGPFTYQWMSNSVPIAGATNASYTTPLTLYAMNGAAYSLVASNAFSSATSSNAVLTLIRDTQGVQILSVGSVDGNSIGVLFSDFMNLATAGNPANYSVNGGAVAVTAVSVRTNIANYGNPIANYQPSYLKTVRLSLGSRVTSGYTVTVKSGILSRTGLPVVQTNLTGSVLGMTDADLGMTGDDPLAAGEAFSAGAGQIEIVAGGSDMMAIGASGTIDHANYAWLERTGNFDVVAKLIWQTPTMAAAKAGIMIRPSSTPIDPSSPALAVTVFPSPGRNTYETAMRPFYGDPGRSWAAPGAPANGNSSTYWSLGGNWIRVRRLGPTFAGYASPDGVTWQLIALATPDTNSFPPVELVGLAASAANNDGRLCEADFQKWGALAFSNAVVAITTNLPANYPSFENATRTFTIGASLTNAPAGELTYQWQRQEPGGGPFSDLLENGNTNVYTTPILAMASDHGAKYRVIAYVGDLTTGHSVTSSVTTLNVSVDTNPPYLVSAGADATFAQMSIQFDGPIEFNSASTLGNYTVTPVGGGAAIAVSAATPVLNADGITYSSVLLNLDSPLSPGAKYTVAVANVLDIAGNNLNATTQPGGKSRVVTGWVLAYGYLKYERWVGPSYPTGSGPYYSTVENLLNNPMYPNSPDTTQLITYSGYPNGNLGNTSVNVFDFGARISGFFIPPTNGSYNFYVRGNDGTALYVSSDQTPVNLVLKAAANVGYTAPGSTWLSSIAGTVVVNGVFGDTNAMNLTAGNKYYLEAVEQQGNGTSWLEFTWGNPTPPGDDVINTAGGAYPTGSAPSRGGAPTNSYNLKGTNIAVYVNPDISVITAAALTNITVEDRKAGSFAVAASAVVSAGGTPSSVPVSFQWYSNNLAVAGATNASYTPPPVLYPSPSVTYSVVMSVSGMDFMTLTNSATLTVLPDSTPPRVVAASSYGGIASACASME
jgi:hypothetical protein